MLKLLDLCCKAGGASVGYYHAATDLCLDIEITGIDIESQKNYPFNFIQADAVEYLQANYMNFTHIHASPPCQNYSVSTSQYKAKGKIYPDNLDAIKQELYKLNLPSVIENVPGAPIIPHLILRGDMFKLKILKKRHFELINFFMLCPVMPEKKGSVKNGDFAQVVGKGQHTVTGGKRCKVEGNSIKEKWSNASGINWMTEYSELAEAIPPAYTRYIGKFLFTHNDDR